MAGCGILDYLTAAEQQRSSAIRFIVCLGVVSLFADMTYEGARSGIGPFLQELGASAAQVASPISEPV